MEDDARPALPHLRPRNVHERRRPAGFPLTTTHGVRDQQGFAVRGFGMKRLIGLVGAGLLSLATVALEAPASAAPYEITVSGVITSSEDVNGLFGITPNAFYTEDTGQPYKAVFTIDPSLGYSYSDSQYAVVRSEYAYNDGEYGDAVSATFSVNGVTVPVAGNSLGNLTISDIPSSPPNFFAISVQDELTDGLSNGISFVLLSNSTLFPTSLGAPFNIATSKDDPGESSFNFQELGGANGDISVTSITSGVISAAPEPSAWVLMIAGVGLVGGMLRYGRRGAAGLAGA